MRQLVTDTGAVPIVLNCEEHDYATAAISHLPHVIAYTLVNLVRTSDSREGLMRQLASRPVSRISPVSPHRPRICGNPFVLRTRGSF